MDLDDLLPQVGEFGRYQKLMLWLVCLPACLPCGFCAFNQLFMANVPKHWCKINEISNRTEHFGIPKIDNISYSSCERYKFNWSNLNEDDDELIFDETSPRESCLDGWQYDTKDVSSSIVIDVGKSFFFNGKSKNPNFFKFYFSSIWFAKRTFTQL